MAPEPGTGSVERKESAPPRLRVSVFRHAETEYNKNRNEHRVTVDDTDDLTKEGAAAYHEVADAFAASVGEDEEVIVYTSAYDRALQSADIMLDALKRHGRKIRVHGLFKKTERKELADLGKTRDWHWKSVNALMDGGEAEFEGRRFFVDKKLTNPFDLNYPEFFTQGGIAKIPKEATKGWPKGFIEEIKAMETYFEVTRRMVRALADVQRKHAGENCRVVIITHRALMHFLGDFFTRGAKQEFEPGESIELEEQDGELVVTRVGTLPVENGVNVSEAFKSKKRAIKKGQAVTPIGAAIGLA